MAVLEDLEQALKRCIPKASLPMNYPDHQTLACELVMELADSVVLMSKRDYDSHVRRMAQVKRAEQAILRGMKGK